MHNSKQKDISSSEPVKSSQVEFQVQNADSSSVEVGQVITTANGPFFQITDGYEDTYNTQVNEHDISTLKACASLIYEQNISNVLEAETTLNSKDDIFKLFSSLGNDKASEVQFDLEKLTKIEKPASKDGFIKVCADTVNSQSILPTELKNISDNLLDICARYAYVTRNKIDFSKKDMEFFEKMALLKTEHDFTQKLKNLISNFSLKLMSSPASVYEFFELLINDDENDEKAFNLLSRLTQSEKKDTEALNTLYQAFCGLINDHASCHDNEIVQGSARGIPSKTQLIKLRCFAVPFLTFLQISILTRFRPESQGLIARLLTYLKLEEQPQDVVSNIKELLKTKPLRDSNDRQARTNESITVSTIVEGYEEIHKTISTGNCLYPYFNDQVTKPEYKERLKQFKESLEEIKKTFDAIFSNPNHLLKKFELAQTYSSVLSDIYDAHFPSNRMINVNLRFKTEAQEFTKLNKLVDKQNDLTRSIRSQLEVKDAPHAMADRANIGQILSLKASLEASQKANSQFRHTNLLLEANLVQTQQQMAQQQQQMAQQQQLAQQQGQQFGDLMVAFNSLMSKTSEQADTIKTQNCTIENQATENTELKKALTEISSQLNQGASNTSSPM